MSLLLNQVGLPIFFSNDAPHEGSWIYLALILNLLKVRRAVILLLKQFCEGYFLEIWCCVWLRKEETKVSRNCCIIYLKSKHLCKHCIYSQTCSNDHLYKMTTCLRRQMLSLPKQIPIQSLLYKMITCLTWPTATFFVSHMKKCLSKTTITKLYPAEEWETNIRQQCIKQ